jgi:hypothetical protein
LGEVAAGSISEGGTGAVVAGSSAAVWSFKRGACSVASDDGDEFEAVSALSAEIDKRGAWWSLQAAKKIVKTNDATKQLLLVSGMLCKVNV